MFQDESLQGNPNVRAVQRLSLSHVSVGMISSIFNATLLKHGYWFLTNLKERERVQRPKLRGEMLVF